MTSGGDARPRRIPALDGIRAVAVTLVVLFHLGISSFQAGFAGVDVFFVLSGFLITSLLIEEIERTNRVSFSSFWARRARRLIPALALVLVAIAIVARLSGAPPTELAQLRGDLVSTAAYVANWHLIGTTSYFGFTGVESPVLHTWSLAIEEQFYLVWPLVVGGLVLLTARWRRGIAIVAGAAGAASVLFLAIQWTADSAERAYMGTDTKLFEPLVGALGAVLVTTPWIRRQLSRHGPALSVAAVVGLAATLLLISPRGGFYYEGGALVLCVLTLVLVAALWLERGGAVGRALGWGPAVWVGAISYGIYLWHWPMTLWTGVPDASGAGFVLRCLVAVALTVAAAAVSFFLLERPIREGVAGRRLARNERARRNRWTLAAVPVVLLGVVSISVVATAEPPRVPGAPVVMLVGDSVTLRFVIPLDRAMADGGGRVVAATFGGCPVTGEAPAWPDGDAIGLGCPIDVRAAQDRVLERYDPDLVVWWDRFSVAGFVTAEGERVVSGSERFWTLRRAALDRTVRRLHSRGARILLVATEPPGATGVASSCVHGTGDQARWCRFMVAHYVDITTLWNEELRRYAGEHPDIASFTSITDDVCRTDVSPCDDRIEGVGARWDGVHYSREGTSRVVEALLRAIRPFVERATPSP